MTTAQTEACVELDWNSIETKADYLMYTWKAVYDDRVKNLLSVKLVDHPVEIIDFMIWECMSFGGDYEDGRRKWLDENEDGIKKIQAMGQWEDIEDVFKRVTL